MLLPKIRRHEGTKKIQTSRSFPMFKLNGKDTPEAERVTNSSNAKDTSGTKRLTNFSSAPEGEYSQQLKIFQIMCFVTVTCHFSSFKMYLMLVVVYPVKADMRLLLLFPHPQCGC